MNNNKIHFSVGGQSSGKMARVLSNRLDCGCVVGYYWCSKHDIYTKQDPNDMPHHVNDYVDAIPTCCSCHISAPCSFCVNSDDE